MTTTTQLKLNSSQVLILQTLNKWKRPMSREELEQRSGGAASTSNLGLANGDKNGDDHHADSLAALGLVRSRREETGPMLWEITSKGKKAAETFKTRTTKGAIKVPAAILDPVVIRFRATRTYGFELYTDGDIREIKEALGADYAECKVDDLRHQITNRRKQGAFADPQERTRRVVEKILREIGPGGTLVDGLLTPAQLKQLNTLADPA